MGGDVGPAVAVAGAVDAVRSCSGSLSVLLVGDRAEIEVELEQAGGPAGLEVVHAGESVDMGESPGQAIRCKRDASINVTAQLTRDGRAAGMVSAGSSGAVMASALLNIGRLEGVKRPAVAAFIPSAKGAVLLLDVGANVECKPEYLVHFAVMGSLYAERFLGKVEPSVGLLSIGREPGKGNALVRAVYPLLERSPVRFVGNVEAEHILSGGSDVVVCDGFTGNVVLKFAESMFQAFVERLRDASEASLFTRVGGFLVRGPVREVERTFDYEEYGGAPLLGIDGVAIICHGRSTPRAICNALRMAAQSVELGVNATIAARLRAIGAFSA